MVLRRQLRAQPQQAGGINTAHPLAASLVFCGVQSGGVYVDLVSGQVAAQTGTLDTVVLPSAAGSRAVGEARGLRPQANGYLKFAKQTGLDKLTTTGTVLCVAYSAGQHSAAGQYAISSYEEVVGYYGFAFGFDDFVYTSDDGTVLRILSAAGTTTSTSGAVLGSPHANKLHAMGGAWDGTSNYLYYNSLTRATIAGIRTPPSDANRRTNINRMSVTSLGTTGNVLCVGFNRVLTQAEYQAWALAPWAILAPTPRRLRLGPPDALLISFDAASNSGYQAASAGYTFTRTVAGSNRFLVVDVALLSAGQTVTSITDDSTGTPAALTLVGVQTSVTGTGRTESWGLVAPALGTKTVSVVLSGSVASSSAAVSYIGAHQTTPTEAWNSASATNAGAADATVTITPVASNTWIHGMVATDDTAITANQTSRNNVSGAGGSGADEDTGPIASPTPTAVSYTGVGRWPPG